MIIKRVTGGYTAEIAMRVIDAKGTDLEPLTLKVLLQRDGEDLPSRSSDQWREPDDATFPDDGQALLSIMVSESDVAPGGLYWLWFLPPNGDPQRAADDLVRFD